MFNKNIKRACRSELASVVRSAPLPTDNYGASSMIKFVLPPKEETKVEPYVYAIAAAIGTVAGVVGAFIALTN